MDIIKSLIGQAITFAILVWFTMKFVWPPLVKALDERAERIAEGLSAADRAKNDLALAEKAPQKNCAKPVFRPLSCSHRLRSVLHK